MLNITIDEYPPPEKLTLSIVDVGLKQLTFSWSPVSPGCSAIYYNIQASNCGICPNTTNYTNVTCTNVLVNGSGSLCSFAVRTVVCQNITGNESEPLFFNVIETFDNEMAGSKEGMIMQLFSYDTKMLLLYSKHS